MIQSHMKNDKDISQLGMILQGIIEPHVNGGYRIYENTFITDDYPQGIRFISDNCWFETFFSKKSKLKFRAKMNRKIAEKEKLVDALANQVPLLERLLLIHEHQISSELMPFHKSLEKSFQTMKKHFHQKYNRKDSFFNETTQIR